MASPEPPRTPSSPFDETLKEDHGSNSASDSLKKMRSSPRNGIPPKRKPAPNAAQRESTPTGARDTHSIRVPSRSNTSSMAKKPTSAMTAPSSLRSKPRPSALINRNTGDSPRAANENERPRQGSKKRVSIVEPPGSTSPTKKRSLSTIDRRSAFGTSTVRDSSNSSNRVKPNAASSLALRTAKSASRPLSQVSLSKNTSKSPVPAQVMQDSKSTTANSKLSDAAGDRSLSISPPLDTATNANKPSRKPVRPGLPTRKSTQSQTIEQRLREMAVVHQMLRAAMADDSEGDDEEKEEYGRQADEKLAIIREKLAEARKQEGKEVEVTSDKDSPDIAIPSEQLVEQLHDLKERLAESNNEKDRMVDTVRELEEKLQDLTAEKAELGDHVYSLQSENTDKGTALTSLHSNLESVAKSFASRMAGVREVTDEQFEKYVMIQSRLEQVSSRIDGLGTKLDDNVIGLLRKKEDSVAYLRATVEKLQDQVQQLHEQNERDLFELKTNMNDEYQQALDDLNVAHDEEVRKMLVRSREDAASVADAHAKALEDLRERLTIKRFEESRADWTQTDSMPKQDVAVQTTSRNPANAAELESLRREHENVMSAATQRMQDLEQRRESVNNQLRESQETIRNLLAAKVEDDERTQELETRMSKLQDEHQFEEEQRAQERKQGAEARDRLIAELEAVRQQLKLTNDSLAAKEAQFQTTTTRARELSQQARAALSASERHRSITIKTMDDLKTAQEEVSKLRQESKSHELIALREAVKVSQLQQAEAKEELQKANATVGQQQARIVELGKQLEHHRLSKAGSRSSADATSDGRDNARAGAEEGSSILGSMAAFNAQIQSISSMNDELAEVHRQSLQRLNALPTTRNYDHYGLPISPTSMSESNEDEDGDEDDADEEL